MAGASNQNRVIATNETALDAVATEPDVCTVPPSPKPACFPNWVPTSRLRPGSNVTRIAGGLVWCVQSQLGPPSMPAAPPVRPGTKSHTSRAEAVAFSWSADVVVEGQSVVRAFDFTLQNHANTHGGVLPKALAGPLEAGVPPECAFLNRRYTGEETPVSHFDRLRHGAATISAPTTVQHGFPIHSGSGVGPPVAANRYEVDIRGYPIELYAPQNTVLAGNVGLPTPEMVVESLRALPDGVLGQISRITISPVPDDGGALCRASGPVGIIYYPSWVYAASVGQLYTDNATLHESGHAFSIRQDPKFWSDLTARWSAAVAREPRPSLDGANAPAEDFAEALRAYVLARGTPCERWMQVLYPERYKILKRLLDPRDPFARPK